MSQIFQNPFPKNIFFTFIDKYCEKNKSDYCINFVYKFYNIK